MAHIHLCRCSCVLKIIDFVFGCFDFCRFGLGCYGLGCFDFGCFEPKPNKDIEQLTQADVFLETNPSVIRDFNSTMYGHYGLVNKY
uniref:Uncharacterized protein n=1 Tax=Tetranychus urticae TaxID=32264 RepID=T1KAM1_TETUR